MATRAERKAVAALRRKKERRARGCFVVEGGKSVRDLLATGWPVEAVFATEAWHPPGKLDVPLLPVSASEMSEMSALESPQSVLAVAEVPPAPELDLHQGRWLLLDGIRDPGNLGTVLRLADWFGLDGMVLSPDCVDWTSPKVVQASMGSLFRVPFRVRALEELLANCPTACAGAFLDGENLFETGLPAEGWLVIGGESNGIRPELAENIPRRLTIPRFGGAESLNAAMAASVFCAEWRRR